MENPACPMCGAELVAPVRGPMPTYCSARCRMRAMRRRRAGELDVPIQPVAFPPRQRKPSTEDLTQLFLDAVALEASFRFASKRADFRFRPICERMANAISGVLTDEGLR